MTITLLTLPLKDDLPSLIPVCAKHRPLGLLYIGTVLDNEGFDVEIIDAMTLNLSKAEIIRRLKERPAELIGITVNSLNILNAVSLSGLIKRDFPDTRICLGGPHITATMSETLEAVKDVDFLIYGEGEYSFLELACNLRYADRYSEIKGLIYRENRGIVVNEPRMPIEDLDTLPLPEYSLIYSPRNNDLAYSFGENNEFNTGELLASRGCIFHCSFCDVRKIWPGKVRVRSTDNIVDEITEGTGRHDIAFYTFVDSIFPVKKEWGIEICKKIKKRGLKFSWRCNARYEFLDKELLLAMREAGCKSIAFGLESADAETLKKVNKYIDFARFKEIVNLVKNLGINVYINLMTGFPGETIKEAKTTLDFAIALKPKGIFLSVLIAYPGTDLYTMATQNGLVDSRWYLRNFASYVTPGRIRNCFYDADKFHHAYYSDHFSFSSRLKRRIRFFMPTAQVL